MELHQLEPYNPIVLKLGSLREGKAFLEIVKSSNPVSDGAVALKKGILDNFDSDKIKVPSR